MNKKQRIELHEVLWTCDMELQDLKTLYAPHGNATYKKRTHVGTLTFEKICKALFALRNASRLLAQVSTKGK